MRNFEASLVNQQRREWRDRLQLERQRALVEKFSRRGRSSERAMFEMNCPVAQDDGSTLIGYTVFVEDLSVPTADERLHQYAAKKKIAYTFTFVPVFLESRAATALTVAFSLDGQIRQVNQVSTNPDLCGHFYPHSDQNIARDALLEGRQLIRLLAKKGHLLGPNDQAWERYSLADDWGGRD